MRNGKWRITYFLSREFPLSESAIISNINNSNIFLYLKKLSAYLVLLSIVDGTAVDPDGDQERIRTRKIFHGARKM